MTENLTWFDVQAPRTVRAARIANFFIYFDLYFFFTSAATAPFGRESHNVALYGYVDGAGEEPRVLGRYGLHEVAGKRIVAAIAQAVMPEGSVKAVGRFACGLLVFLAVARPVLGIEASIEKAAVSPPSNTISET